MAVRITHQNNSDGHDGAYVYRSTSPMDPQNLPAPIADEAPATGATFEYIDNTALADGTYYYRTQDHEAGSASVVSDEVSITLATDYAGASLGDPIGGGYYAGTITYADARQFHIIVADVAADISGLQWRESRSGTAGTDDLDDGVANTQSIETVGIELHPAAEHCVNYSSGGYGDWYLGSINEVTLLFDNLDPATTTATNFQTGGPQAFTPGEAGELYWSSTENTSTTAKAYAFYDGGISGSQNKDDLNDRTRPIRRVPV